MRRPGLSRKLMAIHEHTALAGLVAIAVHGITLLGDPWLHPGVGGVAVPFAMGFRPALHRPRRHRRLPGRAARPQLLRPQADRPEALAQGPPGDGRRLPARPRPRPRRRHRRLGRLVPLVGHADRAADRRPLRLPRALAAQAKKRHRRTRARPAASAPHPRGAIPGPRPRGGMMNDPGVVIVGGGLAAQRCRRDAPPPRLRGPVRIVCAEPDPPYDRPPLSKELLAGTVEEESVAYRPAWWYEEQRGRAAARRPRRGARPARAHRSRSTPAPSSATSKLLIATGSAARRLPVPRGLRERPRPAHPRRRPPAARGAASPAPDWRSSAPASSARRSPPRRAASASR